MHLANSRQRQCAHKFFPLFLPPQLEFLATTQNTGDQAQSQRRSPSVSSADLGGLCGENKRRPPDSTRNGNVRSAFLATNH
jgi:hypothetical protein